MAVQIILKNSSVEDKHPTPTQLANGELALNYNEAGAFLSCRDSAGNIQQVGGVKIEENAPLNPVKNTQWLKPSTLTLFIYDGTSWLPLSGGGGGGGDIVNVIGGKGIDAEEIAGVVTLDVDLAGGDDGLEFNGNKLTASIATESSLGSVIIGNGIDVDSDGTISVDIDEAAPVITQDTAPDFKEDYIWADTSTGQAYVGYKDPSGDEVWLAIGGADGKDGVDGTDGTDGADGVLLPAQVLGGDGVEAVPTATDVTLNVDLAGGDDGLEIDAGKLKASVATAADVGSIKPGQGLTVDLSGTLDADAPIETSDAAPAFKKDYFWLNSSTGKAYAGYQDPSGDQYWIGISGKDGADGADGADGVNGVLCPLR